MKLAYVCLFGCLGVMLRYGLNALLAKPGSWPWTTFAINVSGSFFIGLFYALAVERSKFSLDLAAGLMVGLLGGFTTFSAFSLETLLLARQSWLAAGAYAFGSPIAGTLAALAGWSLGWRFI